MPESGVSAWTSLFGDKFKQFFFRSKIFTIVVEWDADAEVFIASSDDIDGLVVEAETINEMVTHLQEVIPMLLEENRQSLQDFDFHIKSPGRPLVQAVA